MSNPTIWSWTLGVSGAMTLFYYTYRFFWIRRHRRPLPQGWTRLDGRVSETIEGGFLLKTAEELVVVSADKQRFDVGRWVVAEGLQVGLPSDELLYRDAEVEPRGLAARRVVTRLPELRWLQLPVALACLVWLLSLTEVLFSNTPSLLFR